jgi:5-methyltetrahydropteroyltriglutamate--homocysteine methyltransferase
MMKQGGSYMLKSCDVGSLPLVGDSKKFVGGAKRFSLYPVDESVEFFEERVLESLLDKIKVGVDVPNYPQFRDMNEMFLSMIEGIEKVRGGYLESQIPSVKSDRSHIPEVSVIEKHSQRIKGEKGEHFEVKICVTGPYTLSSLFLYRDKGIFTRLGNAISQIVENNIFNDKHGRVGLVSIDEPVFGLQDDPLIDFGSGGRENLLRAWESIFQKAKSKNAQTALHIHSTTDELFWSIDSLSIIDSHVDDPLYKSEKTKEKLESTDKFLKASIVVSEFDALIRQRILSNSREKLDETSANEKLAETWKDITYGRTDPELYLESVDIVKARLDELVGRIGVERIPVAGPECGLKGFPTYKCAMECLRRVSSAIKSFTKEHRNVA